MSASYISYPKAIQALYIALEEPSFSKDQLSVGFLAKAPQEFKTFVEQLKGSESYKRIFRMTMENLMLSNPRNAVFFAEKLATLTDKHPLAIYLLGDCYLQNSDYLKVYQMFQAQNVLYLNDNFLLLACKALFANKQYQVCESVIAKQTDNNHEVSTNPKLRSQKLLLLAKCQESLEKKKSATTSYYECLKSDPTNSEALTLLMDSYLINQNEKEQFLNNIPFSPEDTWLKKYYLAYIKESALDENKNTLNREAPSRHITNSQLNKELFKTGGRRNENHLMDIESEDQGAMPFSGSGTKTFPGVTPFLQSLNFGGQPTLGSLHNSGLSSMITGREYPALPTDQVFDTLVKKENIDILCIKAKNAFMKYDIQTAHKLSKE